MGLEEQKGGLGQKQRSGKGQEKVRNQPGLLYSRFMAHLRQRNTEISRQRIACLCATWKLAAAGPKEGESPP